MGSIVKGLVRKGTEPPVDLIKSALSRYAELLRPWAKTVAEGMVTEVARRDAKAWFEVGASMGREIHKEIVSAPTGAQAQRLMAEQVDLITSLPLEAAQRVHQLALGSLYTGDRPEKIEEEILETGKVTEARARLIARTEVGRAAAAMTQARAQHIGSEGYIWRTAGDADVRPEHKKLEGRYVRWGEPPIAGENGMRYHAGAGPNCRCYQEPVIPDTIR